MPYRIVDWNIHFENNRTREMKSMDWVPMKNRMDGYGYVELVDHPNGAAHFGAWVAIVEIASRCPIRGTLMALTGKGETPHTPASLARISRIPAAIFEEAIPRLAAIGWVEYVEAAAQEPAPGSSPKNRGMSQVPAKRGTTTPQEPAEYEQDTPQEPAPSLDSIPQEGAALREHAQAHSLNGTERKEQNGTERKNNARTNFDFEPIDELVSEIGAEMKKRHAKKSGLGGTELERALCDAVADAANQPAVLRSIRDRWRVGCEREWHERKPDMWPNLCRWIRERGYLDPAPELHVNGGLTRAGSRLSEMLKGL